MVELLLQRKDIDVNRKSDDGSTPLAAANENGLKNIAKLLREKGAK